MKIVCCLALLTLVSAFLWADDPESSDYAPQLLTLEGGLLFFEVEGPASYETITPSDVRKNVIPLGVVKGQACQNGLSLPLSSNLGSQSGSISGGFGNGGYAKAILNIKKEHPGIEGIYDVKVDTHEIRILSIYSRLCTEVVARSFRS